MWIPERVWEQSLTSDLVEAGVRYTLLDDFHFKNAGLSEDELHGYYITEDDGKLLSVFPGSERLRYTIPFREPQETIDYLRPIAERQPGAVVVFGDDGEKFGSWPGTKEHVYEHGWLRRFFDALVENRSWLSVVTPTEALDQVPPLGKIYIPEGSYREMTEWALPTDRLKEFDQLKHRWEHEGRWHEVAPFVRGGYWRNFKVKYPETNEMYARMQMVSRRLHEVSQAAPTNGRRNGHGRTGRFSDQSLIDQARAELYRGQCNCGYWHGAFGGAYLPHLRNAVYQHLIAADNLLDAAQGRGLAEGDQAWVELTTDDYNFDARPEVRLASNRLRRARRPVARRTFVRARRSRDLPQPARHAHPPRRGLSRRGPRRRTRRRPATSPAFTIASCSSRRTSISGCNSIATAARASSIISTRSMSRAEPVAAGQYEELGDFVTAPFEARLRRNPERMQLQLTRNGRVADRPVRITKGLTLEAGGQTLEIAYLLEGLAARRAGALRRRVQLCRFAGRLRRPLLPRCASQLARPARHAARSARSSTTWACPTSGSASTSNCTCDQPMHVWTFPIETVSQSEAGFELVHQSVVVHPHWLIEAGRDGRWVATMTLAIDTSMAEKRPAVAEVIATA